MHHIPTREYLRKYIHLIYTLGIAFLFITHNTYLFTILILSLFWMMYYEKYRNTNIYLIGFLRTIGMHHVLRPHEKNELTGATYIVIAGLICYICFNTLISALGFCILGISDTAAALVGQAFNKKTSGKSLIGAGAFFFSTLCIITLACFYLKKSFLFWIISCIAGVLCTFAEFFCTRYGIDDNLAIPLVFAGAFQIIAHTMSPLFML